MLSVSSYLVKHYLKLNLHILFYFLILDAVVECDRSHEHCGVELRRHPDRLLHLEEVELVEGEGGGRGSGPRLFKTSSRTGLQWRLYFKNERTQFDTVSVA